MQFTMFCSARKLLVALLLATLGLGYGGRASAAEAPDALVRRISGEVINIAKTDEAILRGNQQRVLALVRQHVLPHIDFERMTSLAVGRYWREATPQQRERLTEEFRDLLVHVYSGAIAQVKDKQLVVKPLRGNPRTGEVIVQSEVIQKGGAEPIELNYRLADGPSGWKIYDVSVLDVWLVQSYRSTFANEIGSGGIDGLIRTLDAKNAKLSGKGGAPSGGS
ncbi:MlaC/ttg2D family ABC transporter substrate-binding protein [Noviherbaspirillum aerium]|uniref:MlaC/ttg2D family ABC transporter substrate-binding protein n=1 Tax=Noviherbaspirillum aerium TaxID=2588497 RepID=UPI00298FA1FD|nr:ABC transporter substrate-binding protein [Noviherbaspirillum aerium]